MARAGSYAVKADLLTSARNEIGGTISATYTVASNFPNQTPTTKQVVASTTRNDGLGGLSTTTHSYPGGRMDYKERRFLGFEYVKGTKPCIAGETQCPYSETWFRQDLNTGPKPEKTVARDGSGKLYRVSELTYVTNEATPPYTSRLVDERHYTYEGATSECTSWPCASGKRVQVTHSNYDAYGNETLWIRRGDVDEPGDESTVERLFVPNPTAYIVGRVAQETVYEGEGTAGEQLHQTRFHYDGLDWNQAPTQGYPTRKARWLDPGQWANQELAYDGWGNLTQDRDETGIPVNYTIDPTYHLFVTSASNLAGEAVEYEWDPICSSVSQETDVNDQVITAEYDAFCRPFTINGPLGSFETTTYPSLGIPGSQNVLVETPSPDPGDGTGYFRSRVYFDGLGRTWRTARKSYVAGGAVYVDTTYNARGSVAAQTAPYYGGDPTHTTTFAYDALDRRTQTQFPDGVVTSTTYGLWEATESDPEGHETVTRYDAHGQVTSTEPEGHRTDYGYDALGRRISMTDPLGNVWAWQYDTLGRTSEQDDPDSGQTTYEYDLAGRLKAWTDAKLQRTDLYYSAQTGRLASKTNAAGTVTFQYSQARSGYFNVGGLTTMIDPSGTAQFDYDALDRTVHVSRTLDGTTYHTYRAYDSANLLRSITYPDGDSISGILYDAAGRIRALPGIFSEALYDASDRAITRQNDNGTLTTWSYDPQRGWLDSIHTSGIATLQDLQYTRDDDGLVWGVSSPFADESWSYSYDDWHRLTTATNLTPPGTAQSFQYNDADGITYNSLVGSYTYPAPGQPRPHAPTIAGPSAYSYDPNGNLLSGGGRTITWNANDLPTLISGAASTSFAYDGFGSRLKKVSGGACQRL